MCRICDQRDYFYRFGGYKAEAMIIGEDVNVFVLNSKGCRSDSRVEESGCEPPSDTSQALNDRGHPEDLVAKRFSPKFDPI